MAESTTATAAPAGPDAPSTPFKPANLALCTVGLALASFMQVLDTTIANVSLPTIAGNLGASSQQVTWVITSFAVSTAIALPLTGWLTRRFGETRLFVWATLAFSLTSLLCGLSQSMGMLVTARVLQGIAAGPMYPLAQSLLVSLYPREKRGHALALLSMVTVVAPISGPILGGWITDNYSWEWIFLINVPLGVIAALIVGTQLRNRPETTEKPPMDYIGLALLIAGVGALQLVLDLGNDEDWFNSDLIITLAVVSAIALTMFLIWELTEKDPIVDLKLFRHRNFCVGTLAMVGAFACFFSIGLLIPLWLNRDMGYTPLWAGLATAPIGILPVMMTPFVARYANRFDMRLLASLAFVIMGISCFMRSGFSLEVDYMHIAGVQLFMGLGTALFFMPMLHILLSDLDGREIASGSGLATFLRTLGASFSASLTTYMWSRRTEVHHAQLTEHISVYAPGVQQQLRTLGQGDPQRGAAIVENMINVQASQIAFNDILYVLGWMFFAMVILLWFARPPFGAGSGGR
ncbi:MAG: DHA2 family efflux MFS transporter permease subunit [Xanthomonadaceae bacterium]|jgi:DHA2 family multidrug resistance protein|nr:DHA2 family efflux MFS transporter permease subunit [Xanthomonadaceae bacterium]